MISFLLSPESKIRIRLASSDSGLDNTDSEEDSDNTDVQDNVVPPRIESAVNQMMAQLNDARKASGCVDVCSCIIVFAMLIVMLMHRNAQLHAYMRVHVLGTHPNDQ